MTGSSAKSSPRFTTTGDLAVTYQFACGDFPGKSNFAPELVDAATLQFVAQVADVLQVKGADTVTLQVPPGTYLVRVSSLCNWSITVSGSGNQLKPLSPHPQDCFLTCPATE